MTDSELEWLGILWKHHKDDKDALAKTIATNPYRDAYQDALSKSSTFEDFTERMDRYHGGPQDV